MLLFHDKAKRTQQGNLRRIVTDKRTFKQSGRSYAKARRAFTKNFGQKFSALTFFRRLWAKMCFFRTTTVFHGQEVLNLQAIYCIYLKKDTFVAKIGNTCLTNFFWGIYNCNTVIKSNFLLTQGPKVSGY